MPHAHGHAVRVHNCSVSVQYRMYCHAGYMCLSLPALQLSRSRSLLTLTADRLCLRATSISYASCLFVPAHYAQCAAVAHTSGDAVVCY